MPTTMLKRKPIPKPIDRPASSASEVAVGIDDVAITVEISINAANAIPKNDGINKITPMTRTTELNLGTRDALIDPFVLHALQSN
jgi:hypothetical protein